MDSQGEYEAHEGSPGLQEIEAHIDRRLAQLTQIHSELDTLRKAKALLIDGMAAIATTPPPKKRTRSRLRYHQKDSHTKKITDAIHAILTEAGEVHRKVITERVEAMNIDLGTGDHVRSLSAYLSQDPRFVTDNRGNWRLAKGVELDVPEFAEKEGPE